MVYGRTLVMPSTGFFGSLFLGLLLLTTYPCFDTKLHDLYTNLVVNYCLKKIHYYNWHIIRYTKPTAPGVPKRYPNLYQSNFPTIVFYWFSLNMNHYSIEMIVLNGYCVFLHNTAYFLWKQTINNSGEVWLILVGTVLGNSGCRWLFGICGYASENNVLFKLWNKNWNRMKRLQ